MGYFMRSSASAGNDIAPPVGDLPDLASTDTTHSITLKNSGVTPASVELAFANTYLQGVDPDSGTVASPTYVVDPDEAGSPSQRIISVARGASVPELPVSLGSKTVAQINALSPSDGDIYMATDAGVLTAGSLTVASGYFVEYDSGGSVWDLINPGVEVISFTGNAGLIQTNAIDVYAVAALWGSVRSQSGVVPTLEYKFGTAGDSTTLMLNTGSLGSAWDLTGNNSMVITDSTSLTGSIGYAEVTSADMNATVSGTVDSSSFEFLASSDRSIVLFFELTAIASTLVLHQLSGGTEAPYYMRQSGGAMTNWSGNQLGLITYNTTHDHTDGGSSVQASVASGVVAVFAWCWDQSASNVRVRWKTLNGNTERAGHSWVDVSFSATTGSSVASPKMLGWTSVTCLQKYHYLGVVDHFLTDAEFNNILPDIGME